MDKISNFNIDFIYFKNQKQVIVLQFHITRQPTPNIIFGLPCVYSRILKLEILHFTSRGTLYYEIGQRLVHNKTYKRLYLQITLAKQLQLNI